MEPGRPVYQPALSNTLKSWSRVRHQDPEPIQTTSRCMSTTNVILLIFGIGTCARGVYALVTQDIIDENEHIVGRAAARHGAILIVLGLGIASHAIYEWPWVTALVTWLRQHE